MALIFSAVLAASAHANYSTQQAADLVLGQPNFISNTENNGGLSAQSLQHAAQICFDGTRLFIADYYNNRVLIFNTPPAGNFASADVVVGQPDMYSNAPNQGGDPAANTLYHPDGVFSDGARLFVADDLNHRVLIYDPIPSSNDASASVVVGQPNANTNTANYGGISANSLNFPTAVLADGGRLFIADYSNNRVLIFNSIPVSDGASADIVLGQPSMASGAGNNGGITAHSLYRPIGLHVSANRLLVADRYNNRVLLFSPIPTVSGTDASLVFGQPNMTSNTANNPALGANSLNNPYSAVYVYGRVYLADSENFRILIFNSLPASNGASADIVLGQPNMTSNAANNPALGANSLYYPWGLYADAGKIWVVDCLNHRALRYSDPVPLPTYTPTATSTPSESSTPTFTLTRTFTPTRTGTVTSTPTRTASATRTPTATVTPTATASPTATLTYTRTATPTATPSSTFTPTRTHSATFTATLTRTPTPTFTVTRTFTPTSTISPTSTLTPTFTISPTRTVTPTITLTCTISPTVLATATLTATPLALTSDQVLAYPAPAAGPDLWFAYAPLGPAQAKIEIFNLTGELCLTLRDECPSAGPWRTRWDIRAVAPGVYFYRLTLQSSEGRKIFPLRKLVIIKR